MKSPEELFDRYLDGELTPEELVALEAWIDEVPRNAQRFVEWSATHLDTRTALQGNALHDAVVQSVDRQTEQFAHEPVLGSRRRRRFLYQHLVTAACVALLMAGGFFLIQFWRGEDSAARSVAQGDARIIQRIDCVLERDRWSVQKPVFQAGESIQLAEGVVVVEFASGATVTLEGPADLEVLSDNSGFLHEGKLTAVVPESAIGFEVLTPDSRVIDHGTEFAVRVDSAGGSETHVFEGEVELIAGNNSEADSRPDSKRLTATEAVRVDGGENPTSKSIQARPQEFIRVHRQTPEAKSDRSEITPLPQQSNLIMWFEASQGVQLDADSRVVSWQNLARTDADELSSAAWQINADHRPLFAARHVANRPAILFDETQKQFLATTPIRTKNDATVILVCEFSRANQHGYGQALALNGSAKLTIQQEWNNVAAAQAYSWKKREQRKVRMTTPTPPNTLFVIACRYSLAKNRFELFANGELIAEDEANGPIAREASHLIGCHHQRKKNFFTGTIAEIVVYDCLLDREGLDTAMSVLMQKYAVQR